MVVSSCFYSMMLSIEANLFLTIVSTRKAAKFYVVQFSLYCFHNGRQLKVVTKAAKFYVVLQGQISNLLQQFVPLF